MADWFDAYTLAARRIASLSDDWHGYEATAVPDQGVMLKGLVCTDIITRGPRKGEPRFRTGDKSTERSVFVSNREAEIAALDLGVIR